MKMKRWRKTDGKLAQQGRRPKPRQEKRKGRQGGGTAEGGKKDTKLVDHRASVTVGKDGRELARFPTWLGSAFLPPRFQRMWRAHPRPRWHANSSRTGSRAPPLETLGRPDEAGWTRCVKPVRLSRVVSSNEQAMLASYGYGWSHSSSVVVTRPVSSADRSSVPACLSRDVFPRCRPSSSLRAQGLAISDSGSQPGRRPNLR